MSKYQSTKQSHFHALKTSWCPHRYRWEVVQSLWATLLRSLLPETSQFPSIRLWHACLPYRTPRTAFSQVLILGSKINPCRNIKYSSETICRKDRSREINSYQRVRCSSLAEGRTSIDSCWIETRCHKEELGATRTPWIPKSLLSRPHPQRRNPPNSPC